MIYAGTVLDLSTVWSLALITSSCMALMNMASIVMLSPDFETCLASYVKKPEVSVLDQPIKSGLSQD